ncbi:DegT/DnrJ/EryC1/StrS family aminotransferase [Nocardia iowensis]|uniref:DegT/DnrJ/EryC1/StrS family aminotransferase n=2 Tax=Nocardia iowensis TaxID=204891 RepID=A0ABX8RI26_NOCIO|nr:DegT/DnrJ/EryC1/StrS family aminotransferase [Nocardia iowensis]QXN88594.1 DegT/DnrJ/EryC1/StrS family aminotransferase [Nocardia iowensis]
MGEPELQAVQRVLSSGFLTNGPETAAFEEEFARVHAVPYAVAMANGTVALTAMLLAHGIGPGDEVIVPSFTFLSTATAVVHAGARPVFAEVHADILNIDADHVAALITARTKAVIAVHYAGQAADMAELRALTDRAGILLLEDAAEAHGASYRGRPVGGLADGAMFSFTPTKNITMGEGGMVTTHDPDYARRLRQLRNHGVADDGTPRTSIGYNWRMTEMQAAIGRVQVTRLSAIIERKQANAEFLAAHLRDADVLFPPNRPDRTATYMMLTLRSSTRRDAIVQGLRDRGIEARVYFPPAHLDAVFAADNVTLPRTEEVANTVFSIPCHAELTEDDLALIAKEITALAPRDAT